jgi:hypothetical protein
MVVPVFITNCQVSVLKIGPVTSSQDPSASERWLAVRNARPLRYVAISYASSLKPQGRRLLPAQG